MPWREAEAFPSQLPFPSRFNPYESCGVLSCFGRRSSHRVLRQNLVLLRAFL